MNSYAQRIGMKNSHFANPHGLPDPQHYTTAHDLALLGRAMIRDFPEQYAYNSMKEFTVGTITQHNRNGLLWREGSGVDGIKTGHTSSAGFCLLASAKRGNQRFVSIVMGIPAKSQSEGFRLRETGNLNLLEWGFRFFESHKLYDANKAIATHQVWKGTENQIGLGLAAPLVISVERGRYTQLKPMMDVPKQLIAPIKKGQVIGKLRVSLDNKVIAERPLVALQDIPEANFFKRLWHEFLLWWES
jgi:D-alanyl-D-alanine carboxypeptidase (penicillin-binding protein 5/6)